MSSAPSRRWPSGCTAATTARAPRPSLDQRRQIEWQGRQAGHRLVVAVHQPNLRWFGDSDSRGQYGYRLITGAYTASLWRMTFGYTPPIQWDTRIKGRGVVGIGEAEELIHHAQIAWMPAEERRRYALTGPPPPQLVHRACSPPPGSPRMSSPKAASSPAHPSSGCPTRARPACIPMPRPMSRPRQHPWYQRKDTPMSRPVSRPRTTRPGPWPSPARPGGPAPRRPQRSAGRAGHLDRDRRPAPRRRPRPHPHHGPRRQTDHRHRRRRILPRLRQARQLPPRPHPPPHPRRGQDRRRAALLDPRRAAQLAVQTENRRQPVPRRRLRLSQHPGRHASSPSTESWSASR